VCEKRYVFNAESPQNFSTPADGIKLGTPWGGFQPQQQNVSLKFNPTGKCPAYQIQPEVLVELKTKQRADDQQIASLSPRTTAAPIKTGRDGGMHPTFLAKLRPQEVRESDGTVRYVVDPAAAKALGSYVNPPLETSPVETESTGTAIASSRAAPKSQQKSTPSGGASYSVASAESRPAPAPPKSESGGMFSSLFASTADSRSEGVLGRVTNSVGRLFGSDDKPAPAAKPAAAAPKPVARPQPAPQPRPQPQQQAAQTPQSAPQPAPPQPEPVAQAAPARQSAASGASLMNGATPTVPAGSFNSRWGGVQQ
jgi:hypothetical protein